MSKPFAFPHFHRRRFGPRTGGGSFFPMEVAKAYGLVKPDGTPWYPVKRNVTIGILGLGDGWNSSDVNQEFQAFGMPTPDITDDTTAGGSNSPGDAADGEVALDIACAAGMFSAMTGVKAQLHMCWGQNSDQGFLGAVNAGAAICDVFSQSWGTAESNWSAQGRQAMSAAYAAMRSKGCVPTAASGDNGSGDSMSGNNADYPSSDPSVLGCGGTNLVVVNGKPVETVWNDGNGGATGGGYSAVFSRPSYQGAVPLTGHALVRQAMSVVNLTGNPSLASCVDLLRAAIHDQASKMRCVPDVAGPADPATGWNVLLNGQWDNIGGTSAVAPMWAGIIAALKAFGADTTNIFSMLYGNPSAFYDVVQGDNGAWKAGPGYDLCTGNGSPNGSVLIPLFMGQIAPPPGNGGNPPPPPPPPPPPTPVVNKKQIVETALAGTLAMLQQQRSWLSWTNLRALEMSIPSVEIWMARNNW